MKLSKLTFYISTLLLSNVVHATATHHSHDETKKLHAANSHAPIAIMGDHLHKKGEYMVSYRYMDMTMKGLLQGTRNISVGEALDEYMMVPKSMDMKMHMFGLMYAPSDQVTLMLMLNYVSNDMDSAMRMMNGMQNGMMGMQADEQENVSYNEFSTSSSGWGDSRLSALIDGFNGDNYRSHFTVGLNLPTGDIDQTDTTPMSANANLGYSMQLGTETFNLLGGYTFVYSLDSLQFGTQLNYETALDDNDRHYEPGDMFTWHNWMSYSLNPSTSLSARLTYLDTDNYSGMDERLNSMMMPTADPKMRGVTQYDVAIGVNYAFNGPFLNGHRIALEWVEPIEQDVEGVQMKVDSSFMLGWQYAF